MKTNAKRWFLGAAALALATAAGCASSGGDGPLTGSVPSDAPPAEVRKAVREVDAARLRTHVDELAGFGTRHTLSDTASQDRGIGAARGWIARKFQEASEESERMGEEGVRVLFDSHTVEPDGRRITRAVEVVNVLCVIPGSNPAARERLYYATAHYDSICSENTDADCDAPGANDNASGTAALIELARVLAMHKLDATVVLMATAGEEQGLYGARRHAERSRAEGRDVRAVLNNDTIGDPAGPFAKGGQEAAHSRRTVRVFSEGVPRNATPEQILAIHAAGMENDGPARTLARFVGEVGAWHGLAVQPTLIYRNDRFLRGGDHTAFLEHGFPAAVRFTVLYEDYDRQHQNVRIEKVDRDGKMVDVQFGDLPSYVEEDYLADVTRLNAAALMHLANAPAPPTNTRLSMSGLENGTRLRWDAPDPADNPEQIAGYEVVVRTTTSAVWQSAKDVGFTNEATLDLSRDNWLFGVRAYDADGYRSPVSFAVPVRE
ncbi:MAG: M28 family metallopeptidase [Phycisphaerales bacterium]|nr:M28 family metallopeptidase [Phycisphaerales bacterium]